MQVMVLLSPLFLDDAKRSYCIQISRFAQSYHRHLQQQRLQQHTTQTTTSTTQQQLFHQQHQHHMAHHEHHEVHEHDIYLQHCDFCLLQVQFALLDGEVKEVISRINIVQTMAQTWVDLSIILTPIAFFSPPAQAPPISISI